MRILRLALFSLVACLSFVAYAACVYYTIEQTNGQKFSSPGQACNGYIAAAYGGASGVRGVVTSDSKGCQVWADPGGGKPAVHVSTKPISKVTDSNCDTQCQSQAGTETIVNWTVGYTRSHNIDADANWKLIGPPNKIPASGLLCNPSSPCELRFSGFSDSDKAWQSASPTADGLYRVSLDVTATVTGNSCTPSNADTAGLRQR